GALRTEAGAFPAGTPYDANDPELKFWVLGTIIESALLVHELFVSPLSANQREEYYSDSLIVAKLFDIPERITPLNYAALHSYMDNMLASDAITVSKEAREIARELFSPSIEGNLLFLGSGVGIGLLPERVRNEFGFQWTGRREAWLVRIAA